MPIRTPSACTVRNPLFLHPDCVLPGTVPWLLAHHRRELFPEFLTSEWRGTTTSGRAAGRAAWPAITLFAALVLRWSEEGVSRLASTRRASTDLSWRAAMGLPIGVGGTPSEKTLREFETWLRRRSSACDLPRYLLLHEHIVRLVATYVEGKPTWAMDSTPMWCFGALKGTLRLLADGLRGLVRRVLGRVSAPVLLRSRLDAWPWLFSKSAKGGFDVDWSDADQRHQVSSEVASAVIDVVGVICEVLPELSEDNQRWVQRRADDLLRVIESDMEEDDDGRLVVARGVARDRIVSITDPEARSGRKTRSQPYKGFKIHVLGDVVSRLIVAIDVVPANAPEAPAGHDLVRRARRVRGDITTVLADTAYGAVSTRLALRAEGVDLVAPPPAGHAPQNGKFSKAEFDIDFARQTAICPRGVETDDLRQTGPRSRFVWPYDVCSGCDSAEACLPAKLLVAQPSSRGRPRTQGRRLVLHEQEEALREARSEWEDPDRRALYKTRGRCEQLVNDVVRHGGRQARAFHLSSARLQMHAIAIRCNLGLLARLLASANDCAIHGSQR